MSHSEETAQTLFQLHHNLKKRSIDSGSLGSIGAAILICLAEFDTKTPFGKKCHDDILAKVKFLLDGVDGIYQESLDFSPSTDTNDLIDCVFFRDFNPRYLRIPRKYSDMCFVRNGKVDHFQAKIQTLVELFIQRIRLWATVLENNGWFGRFWVSQMEIAKSFTDLAALIPKQVDETIYVRRRDENKSQKDAPSEETQDGTVDKEHAEPTGSVEPEEHTEPEEPAEHAEPTGSVEPEEPAEPVMENGYDLNKFKPVVRKVDPIVRDIATILHDASLMRRSVKVEKKSSEDGKDEPKKYRNTRGNYNKQSDRGKQSDRSDRGDRGERNQRSGRNNHGAHGEPRVRSDDTKTDDAKDWKIVKRNNNSNNNKGKPSKYQNKSTAKYNKQSRSTADQQ